MAKGVMGRIEESILNRRVDNRWEVTREEGPKEEGPKIEEGMNKPGGDKDYYIMVGKFKNSSGAELLSCAVLQTKSARQLYNVHFDTKIGKYSVSFHDMRRDHEPTEAHYEGGSEADGKVSGGDEIWINGSLYTLENKGHVQGFEQEEGIFVFSAFGGDFGHNIKRHTSFDGLEFIKDKDQWKFRGPDSRKAQGLEVERLLNDLAKQYEGAVAEAASHLK